MRALLLLVSLSAVACDTAVDNTVGPDRADAAPAQGSLDDVNALFGQACAGAPCHVNSATPASGLDLGPDMLCANVIGVEANDAPGRTLVASGDPDGSYLLCKMLDDCEATGTLMPLGATAQIPGAETVRAWIAAGTPGCD